MPLWNGTIKRIRELTHAASFPATLKFPVDDTGLTEALYVTLGDLLALFESGDNIRCVKDYAINSPDTGVKIPFSSDFGTTNYVTWFRCIADDMQIQPTSYEQFSDGVTVTVDQKCSVTITCIKVV